MGRQINSIEEKRQRRIEEEIAAKTTAKLVAEEYIAKMAKEASLLPPPKRLAGFSNCSVAPYSVEKLPLAIVLKS